MNWSKLTACLRFFGLHEHRCLACQNIYQPGHAVLCAPCIQNLQPHDPKQHCPSCGELLDCSQLLDHEAELTYSKGSNFAKSVSCNKSLKCNSDYAPQKHNLCLPRPCPDCRQNPPPWQKFYFYGTYSGTLRQLLLKGKFHSDLPVLHYLGSLLTNSFLKLDAIVPIPLHPLRLQQRGFNQSYELARPLAKTLQLPLEPSFLSRQINTIHQSRLKRSQRLTNLKDAFTSFRNLVEYKHILLIDDTCTTGSTLRHASMALLEAGAASVQVAVVAKTISIQAGSHVI